MNKKIKKTIIYTLAAGVVGGITAGIAVPITFASNKVNYLAPLNGMKKTTKITGKLTAGDLADKTVDAGIEDRTLLNKAEYAAAFYLYAKEQAASIELQKLKFRFEEYQVLNRMFKTLGGNSFKEDKTDPNDIKIVPDTNAELKFNANVVKLTSADSQELVDFDSWLVEDSGTDVIPDYDNYQSLFDIIQAQIGTNVTLLSKKDKWKARYESIKSSMDAFNDIWTKADTGFVDKLAKLDAGFDDSDYDDSAFTSRYPEVLKIIGELKGDVGSWYGTGIYGEEAAIFMDQRNQVISSAATEEEGEALWAKNLSKMYNGATSEEEAIDYKVYARINKNAFAKNKFKINDTYTVDKLMSGIFNEITGKIEKNAFSYDAASGLRYEKAKVSGKRVYLSEKDGTAQTSFNVKRTDKIYFFGTLSKEIKLINPLFSELPDLFSKRKMMKIQNAVLGFKQGTSLLDGWSLGKDLKTSQEMLKNMFFVRGDISGGITNLNADAFKNLFKDADDNDKWLTKQLIAKYTETKDSTQWKSGDLGYMEGLKATSMAPGFGLGMLASYDYLKQENWFAKNAVKARPNLMIDIRTELVNAFIDAANKEGLAILGTTTVTKDIFKTENQDKINIFIDSLTEEQIKEYFGVAIRNVFNNGSTRGGESGMAQTFVISGNRGDDSGIFAFYSPAFGLHIVKIMTEDFAADTGIKKDLQEVANDQDAKSSVTDYGSLYTNNYPIENQLKQLLADDSKIPDEKDKFSTYLNDHVKNYEPKGKDIATDVKALINSLVLAAEINRVQKSGWSKLSDYLIKQFDAELIDPTLSMDPEKIYEAILAMGGDR